jgi:hypothetical protein
LKSGTYELAGEGEEADRSLALVEKGGWISVYDEISREEERGDGVDTDVGSRSSHLHVRDE